MTKNELTTAVSKETGIDKKTCNAIINSIAALEERIAGVEGKLAKVEEPAANPVDETPEVKQSANNSILSYLRKN